jgi:hypothetical protein
LGAKQKLLVFRHELDARSEAIGLEVRRGKDGEKELLMPRKKHDPFTRAVRQTAKVSRMACVKNISNDIFKGSLFCLGPSQ